MNLFNYTDIARSAKLSDCGKYRYELTRSWRPEAKKLGWIMLNPSTADAMTDDPTIRKCMAFARAWDFGGIVVANLFHLRATDPAELEHASINRIGELQYRAAFRTNATGPNELDRVIYEPVMKCDLVMVAWGSHKFVSDTGRDCMARALAVTSKKPLHCLAINADGQPRHPLYVRGDTKPIIWFDPQAGGGEL